uniref:Large ribosomal subunit protein bL32c n=1 Tax=Olisthodiscus luteus TaxID=83000 RepID=A0A7U0KSJ5_OLILU|nr:ribosomal protein L32 [Olisthodiscus luteus]QQW50477.1 ribosomal protein L32 [Olisthodiscus luteus]
MAVPKKRTSKSKKNSRRATWNNKIVKEVQKALTLGYSLSNDKKKTFIYKLESN